MLDRTKVDIGSVGIIEFEWHALTKIERRLIVLYRQLSEKERQHMRRLTEVLVSNTDELSAKP